MKKRALSLVAVALALIVAVPGHLRATPGSGVTQSYRVVSSDANIYVESLGNLLKLRFGSSKSPVNILNVHLTFAPGAFSGWHTHSGPGIVIVERGTITIEETEGCFTDYPEGSVLFEGGPDRVHNARNLTTEPVILDSYFFLPAFDPPGANSRIDAPVQYGPCVENRLDENVTARN